MEVVIVKMPLLEYEAMFNEFTKYDDEVNWLVKEQYFETEEILALEILININKQIIKDDYIKLKELKHPKK